MYSKYLILLLIMAYCFPMAGAETLFIRVKDIKNNEYLSLKPGTAAEGVSLKEKIEDNGKASFHTVTISSKTNEERNLLVSFSLPVPAKDTLWLIDPRHSETVKKDKIYFNYSKKTTLCGLNGKVSFYPFGAMISGDKTYGIGLDPDMPAVFRIEYDAKRELLSLNFDIALIPEKPEAVLKCCVFNFDPAWSFRGALAKYYEIFPDAFTNRIKEHGLMMPFDEVAALPGWQDFGFKFREMMEDRKPEPAKDIICFRYWEPSTWWMKIPPEVPRNYEDAIRTVNKLAENGDRRALSVLSSAYYDENGKAVLFFANETWCNGCVWNLNPLPGVKGEVTCYNMGWYPKKLKDYDSPDCKFGGEYLDSEEGFMIMSRDFRKSNILAAASPLTYSIGSGKICVFKGMALFEYAHKVASDVHARGKLMGGNNVPVNWSWMAPMFDMMGTEVDWNKGKWLPTSDEACIFSRAMCKGRPFGMAQNSNFDKFTPEMVEKYMKRCTAYAFFPGFFAGKGKDRRYFKAPVLYERDRALFKKYIPWCKKLSEAGWEPITNAKSSDEHVYLERFGKNYFTIFNDSNDEKRTSIQFDDKNINKVFEWTENKDIEGKNGKFDISISPEGLAVFEINKQ